MFPIANKLPPKPTPNLPQHYGHGFLQVPQIAWGLNNQKIAIARSALTARFLNRSLLLPSLSASLTYKNPSLLQPLPFDHLFSLPLFNSLCHGFVSISSPHQLPPHSFPFNVSKGSGRRWTSQRDLRQLSEWRDSEIGQHSLLRIVGKNPFLWQDHWPVRDYARVFQCLVLVDNLSAEADRIVSKLRENSHHLSTSDSRVKPSESVRMPNDLGRFQYVSVHMRLEKDWMIHCRNLEDRARTRKGVSLNICSSKQEIIERVSRISYLQKPSLIYLAVGDVLLEDHTLLDGWEDGLFPFEKKKLGVLDIYKKYPYLLQSAIDYEVCLRADIFVGNTYSTFSALVVLERTVKMLHTHPSNTCGTIFPSFAYNLIDEKGGPQPWITNLSEPSLQSISYGTNHVSCVL